MAGIIYRTCEFDNKVSAALSEFQGALHDSRRAFEDQASTAVTRLALFTAASDASTALTEMLKLNNVASRDALRTRYGLGARLTTDADYEEWLLDNFNIAIVNGIYVPQTSTSVVLAAYRTLYAVVGLSALDSALSGCSSGDYFYYIQHDGIVYSATTPKALEVMLEVGVADFDAIYFAWVGSPRTGARSELQAAGFPSAALYKLVRGESYNNITTLVVPRADIFTQLRTLGYTNTELTLLLSREIAKVLIDSDQIRADDDLTTFAGVYQTVPYPGEGARALAEQLSNLPPPGQLRVGSTGARSYLPPTAAVFRVLDPVRSFRLSSFVQDIADRVSSNNQTAQAFLSVMSTQTATVQSAFSTAVTAIGSGITDIAEMVEDAALFLGIDLSCGTSTATGSGAASGGGTLGGITFSDFGAQLEALAEDFEDTWGASVSCFSMQGMIYEGLIASLEQLTCGAISLSCITTELLEDAGGDGGPFDEDGATDMALFEMVDVMNALETLATEQSSGLADLINAANCLGDLARHRASDCYASNQYVRGILEALTV